MSSITPTSASTGVTGTGTTGGKNTIAEGVVSKVAGIAAREVRGVHDLGNGAARAIGAIRNVINQQDRGQGVSVEVGEKQVAAAAPAGSKKSDEPTSDVTKPVSFFSLFR